MVPKWYVWRILGRAPFFALTIQTGISTFHYKDMDDICRTTLLCRDNHWMLLHAALISFVGIRENRLFCREKSACQAVHEKSRIV
jgi:hypothetical protein